MKPPLTPDLAPGRAPPLERHFYDNLEALRGIAALAVVLHHAPFPGRISETTLALQSWLFVDFFFVLSGFVIALVHFDKPTGPATARQFLIRRIFRVYPLHLVTMIFVGAMLAVRIALDPTIGPQIGVDDRFPTLLVANIFLVQSWGFSGGGTLNVPSWSISTEWLAYLVSAGIVATIAAPGKRLAALVAIGASALALLVVFNGATLDGDLTYRALRCLYSFALGAIAWRLARPLRQANLAMALQLTSLAAIAAIMAGALVTTHLTLLFPPVAALLVWAAAADRGSPLYRALVSRPARWIGERSYSIYMIHLPLFMLLAFLGKRLHLSERLAGFGDLKAANDFLVIGSIALVLTVATHTYRWIEHPWRERGRRVAQRSVSPPPAKRPALP